MKKDFNEWISNFKTSISDYGYYVDFNKVIHNVDNIKIELNILNSLIGSKTIKDDFINIIKKYPETLKVIPILIAVRNNEIEISDVNGCKHFNFNKPNYSIEEYVEFMENTGLFNLIQNHIVSNLIDYVLGVETGLDSNGRKNRGGHLMENLVEKYIISLGFIKDKTYFKEMYQSDVETTFGLDLKSISNDGRTEKRFDYVVKTDTCVYAIETNFYTGGGSKLNETARSYKTLALESKSINGFKFVWITDGIGWISARHNLEETFDVLDDIYCLEELQTTNIFL